MLPDGRIKLFSHVELGLYGETWRTLWPLCAGLDEKATLRPLSFFFEQLYGLSMQDLTKKPPIALIHLQH